jgi:hypothetical protein
MQSARRKLPRSKTSGTNDLRRYSFRSRHETSHNRALHIIGVGLNRYAVVFSAIVPVRSGHY